jgi:Ran GTPase-activating protein (RanGAP) involved in mRNA processing and transport
MIEENRPLKVLILSKNKFDVRAARRFSEAILKNNNLHVLDLSFNAIKDEGVA